MAETWVRPPLLGREAPPTWIALWRFRLVVAVLLVVLVLVFVALYRQLTGATAQDPGVSDTPGVPGGVRPTSITVPQLPGDLPGEP